MSSRYPNELDHWRSSSQHPLPSRSTEHSPNLPPKNMKASFSFRNDGWAFDASPTQAHFSSSTLSSSAKKRHKRSISLHYDGSDYNANALTDVDLLEAVSNEDIVNLTKLANTLPQKSRSRKEQKEYRHDQMVSHDQIKASIRKQGEAQSSQGSSMHESDTLTDHGDQFRSPTADTDPSAFTASNYDPSTLSVDTEDTLHRLQRQKVSAMIHDYKTGLPADSYPSNDLTLNPPSTLAQPSRRTWHMNFIKRDKKGRLVDHPCTSYDERHDVVQPTPSLSIQPITSTSSSTSSPLWKRASQLKRLRFAKHHRSTSHDVTNPPPRLLPHIDNQPSSSRLSYDQPARNASSASPSLLDGRQSQFSTTSSHKSRNPFSSLLGRRHSFDNMRDLLATDDTQPASMPTFDTQQDDILSSYPTTSSTMHLISSTDSSTNTSVRQVPILHSPPHPLQPEKNPTDHLSTSVETEEPSLPHDQPSHSPDLTTHSPLAVTSATPPNVNQATPEADQQLPSTPTPAGPKRMLYFDVDALPGQNSSMSAFVQHIVQAGFGEYKTMRILFDYVGHAGEGDTIHTDDDDDAEDDTEDIQGDNAVNDREKDDRQLQTIKATSVITPNIYSLMPGPDGPCKRRIAQICVDDVLQAAPHVKGLDGFEKLVCFPKKDVKQDQASIAEKSISDQDQLQDQLLNLRVQLAPLPQDFDTRQLVYSLKTIDDRLQELEPFLNDTKSFLIDNLPHYQSCLGEGELPSGLRPASRSFSGLDERRTTTRTSRAYTMVEPPTPAPLGMDDPHSYQYYHKKLNLALSSLQQGGQACRESLESAEDLLRKVKNQVLDTTLLLDDRLKDVSDDHYSKLNDLEVNVDSIMANRSKSRGMDLIYLILTVFLTGLAFLLWALIWAAKFIRDAVMLPVKVLRTYKDHVQQRNDDVQKKSRISVANAVERPSSSSSSSSSSRQSSFTSNPPPLKRTSSGATYRNGALRRPSSSRT